MAHFAQLDENNVVINVIVVANEDTSDANGVEKESIGIAFLERHFGGNWKKTSYNGKIRGKFAALGDEYNAQIDKFVSPKIFQSWVLNLAQGAYVPPVDQPAPEENYIWTWDENAYLSNTEPYWVKVQIADPDAEPTPTPDNPPE